MLLKTRLFFIVFLLNLSGLSAQQFTQIVRGKVVDGLTQMPLTGATVQLHNTAYATTSDEQGKYRLENIPVGRYQLIITYLGYENLRISEVLVETGKEVVHTIELNESTTALKEVIVRAEKKRVTHPISTRTITVEETRRFPATFFDPARLATAYAGVINANDQANALIIRGNSPASINWQIAGAEIVNPNHTPNAGTFNDRPTFNGGGTNILSAQMLDKSTLLTGAFPVQYGNALSGILDMNFREGNNEKYEFTGQIGLIGIDVAAEGPFNKKSDASFLFNYRYSTIGLLGALGVPLGDEEINFQDVSFNVNIPTKGLGKFTLFGMGGQSENIFEKEEDSSLREEQKDRFDIHFDSKMGAIGLTHRISVGSKGIWQSTLAYSATENFRRADQFNDELEHVNVEVDESNISKLSLATNYQFQLDAQNQLIFGLNWTNQVFNTTAIVFGTEQSETASFLYQQEPANIVRPFLNLRSQISKRLTANIGISQQNYFLTHPNVLLEPVAQVIEEDQYLSYFEPRLSLKYQWNRRQSLSLAYGKHSQFQSPFTRTSVIRQGELNGEDPVFNQAHHIILGFEQSWKNDLVLSLETYYQHLEFEPIFPIDGEVKVFYDAELIAQSRSGKNIGIDINLQKFANQGFYYLINSSIYQSTFVDQTNQTRDTRYNGNYVFNVTTGKEWKKQKENRVSIFGINGRFNYRGGFRQTPINLERSRDLGYTIYTDQIFSERQADFYKLDLRVYWKRNKAKYSNTLAIDIQNVTNRQNVAFNYYDTLLQQVITKYQLGIIPIISYRIEF